MTASAKKTLQTILFAIIGIGLMWLVLRKIDFNRLGHILNGARWGWLVLGLAINILSNVVRGLRWNMLLNPLGYKPRTLVSWFAVQIGYGANLIIPRLGEVSRCAVLQQYEDIPLDKSLGTVVTERLADLAMLALIVPLALLLQYDVFMRFIGQLPWGNKQGLLNLLIIGAIAGVIGVAGTIYFFKKFKTHPLVIKITHFVQGFVSGLSSIGRLKNPGLFIFHTILMWVLYWLTSYFIFRCFDFSQDLTLLSALVLLATGTFGFVAPVQGGLGAYEVIAIATLQLYGLNNEQATAYALLNHFGQIITQVVVGLSALLILAVFYKKHTLNKIEAPSIGA